MITCTCVCVCLLLLKPRLNEREKCTPWHFYDANALCLLGLHYTVAQFTQFSCGCYQLVTLQLPLQNSRFGSRLVFAAQEKQEVGLLLVSRWASVVGGGPTSKQNSSPAGSLHKENNYLNFDLF